MGLTVTLVAGPRRSGKTTVIAAMISEVLDRPPHYMRLAVVDSGVRLPARNGRIREPKGATDAQWLCCDRERIFELLPESLAAIHKRDRYGRVLIEADADPVLPHAYPFDQQVFVMPAPRTLSEVFRTPRQAARALQDSLDDTTEFAAEVFGLVHSEAVLDDDSGEERTLLSQSQIKHFLDSPLGEQLASRIQLQSAYHGLAESDLVVVNTGLGGGPNLAGDCRRRLVQLLTRSRGAEAAQAMIYCCDPHNQEEAQRCAFFEALRKVTPRR